MKQHVGVTIASVVLGALFCLVIHYRFARPWNPRHSNDTHYYFYPEQEILNSPEVKWGEIFLRPFFSSPSLDVIEANYAKPVFVDALRLWGMLYRLPGGSKQYLPDDREYSDFVVVSCFFLFLSICFFASRRGSPFLGVITALATLLTPWGFSACYFTTYTAGSMALFYLAAALLWEKTPRYWIAGGLLMGLLPLCNQSAIVFVIGTLAARALLLPRADMAQRATHFIYLLLLFLAPVALLDLSAGIFNGIFRPCWAQVLLPSDVLTQYLARSATERTEYFSAYRSDLFFTVLAYSSRVLLLLVCLTPLPAVTWYLRSAGGKNWYRQVAESGILGLLLPPLIGILITDLRVGPQFSRTYIIGFPMLLLAVFKLWEQVSGSLRWSRAVIALACGALFLEMCFKLPDQFRAFQGVSLSLRTLLSGGANVAVLRPDRYRKFLNLSLGLCSGRNGSCADPLWSGQIEILDSACSNELARHPDVQYVVVGPMTGSVLDWTDDQPSSFAGISSSVGCRPDSGGSIHLVKERSLPFFALYPLLLLEDPAMTYRFMVRGDFGPYDYRNEKGSVTLWRVVRNPKPTR